MIEGNFLNEKFPEECSLTIEHIEVHLTSAINCFDDINKDCDVEQLSHDLYIIARISAELFNETEKKLNAPSD